jgi:hypothetical protein
VVVQFKFCTSRVGCQQAVFYTLRFTSTSAACLALFSRILPSRSHQTICTRRTVIDCILPYAWHNAYLQHIPTITLSGDVQPWVREKAKIRESGMLALEFMVGFSPTITPSNTCSLGEVGQGICAQISGSGDGRPSLPASHKTASPACLCMGHTPTNR